MYYTYVLRCEDKTLYTGITTDVKRRFEEHASDRVKGAKYTARHRPVKIEAVWESETRSLASKLEFAIKKLAKSEKEELVKTFSLEILKDKIDISKYKKENIE